MTRIEEIEARLAELATPGLIAGPLYRMDVVYLLAENKRLREALVAADSAIGFDDEEDNVNELAGLLFPPDAAALRKACQLVSGVLRPKPTAVIDAALTPEKVKP